MRASCKKCGEPKSRSQKVWVQPIFSSASPFRSHIRPSQQPRTPVRLDHGELPQHCVFWRIVPAASPRCPSTDNRAPSASRPFRSPHLARHNMSAKRTTGLPPLAPIAVRQSPRVTRKHTIDESRTAVTTGLTTSKSVNGTTILEDDDEIGRASCRERVF